jgi:hypothetical protein
MQQQTLNMTFHTRNAKWVVPLDCNGEAASHGGRVLLKEAGRRLNGKFAFLLAVLWHGWTCEFVFQVWLLSATRWRGQFSDWPACESLENMSIISANGHMPEYITFTDSSLLANRSWPGVTR